MSDAQANPLAGGDWKSPGERWPAEPLCYADEFRYWWEAREKWDRDVVSIRAEGYAEGYAQGYAEGYAEGVESVSRTCARRLLAKGFPCATVAQLTDLPLAVVEAMRPAGA